jgi:hypothetical protein
LFTHCCQHAPCCIASSQPGSRREREPKIFENRALDQCRTAAASRPPALPLLRTAASRQVIAGVVKAWLRATHLSLLHCTVRSCTPNTSYLARAESSAPSDLGDRITQTLQAEACRRKKKDSERTTCVISMRPLTFSSSLPGGRLGSQRSSCCGWAKPLSLPLQAMQPVMQGRRSQTNEPNVALYSSPKHERSFNQKFGPVLSKVPCSCRRTHARTLGG